MITRPMLAAKCDDIARLQYPVIGSPKIDGIRCLRINGRIVSRTLKPIPNESVRGQLLVTLPDGGEFDGELVSGDSFNSTTSAIMKRSGVPSFFYWVFDHVLRLDEPYCNRVGRMEDMSGVANTWGVLPTELIESEVELLAFEEQCIDAGFEGVCLRHPRGRYKCGRSTFKEGLLIKLKRFEDSEATIVGWEELMHNDNEKVTNALGLSERSHAKDGKRPGGTLGKLIARTPDGIEFGIGSGFTNDTRAQLWAMRDSLPGTLVKYKHQPHGKVDAPRLPVFLGLRSKEDSG